MSGTEVSFISSYTATMSRIRQSACTSHHTCLDNDSEPGIKDLARHSSTDSSSSNVVDVIDRFLSFTRLPSFEGSPSAARGKLQIDSHQLAAVVTFDFAVCSRAMPEVSQELLRIAQGKLKSADTKRCPQTCTSLKSFIDDMIKLLHVVTVGKSNSVDSLTSLLALYMFPLEADDFQLAVNGLALIEKALNQTHNALSQHGMHPMANCLCSCSPDELLAHFADVCHDVLPRGGLLPVLQRYITILFIESSNGCFFLDSIVDLMITIDKRKISISPMPTVL